MLIMIEQVNLIVSYQLTIQLAKVIYIMIINANEVCITS